MYKIEVIGMTTVRFIFFPYFYKPIIHKRQRFAIKYVALIRTAFYKKNVKSSYDNKIILSSA